MLIKVLNQIITLILCLLEISCVNSKQEMFNLTKAYSEIFIQDNECINSDKITAFIESQVDLIDSNFKEVITEQSNIYIALCDIDDNGIPEFFLGSLIRTGINYCCYDLNFQPIFNFTGGADRPFLDGRKYKNPDGIEYYRTVTYIGNPTYPGAIICVLKSENGTWTIEYTETYDENEIETKDSFEILEFSEVLLDRQNIEKSVQECIENYFSNEIFEKVEKRKAELNNECAPWGVTSIYEGSAFDVNNDGIDDYIYAFPLYNQFHLAIIDGVNNTYLFDERIMTAFDENNCRVEIYTNPENLYAVKAVGRNIYASEAELTEVIQIFCAEKCLTLEGVYDKETGQFLHAYGKYTFDEYSAKQNEFLDGYSFKCVIKWLEA